MKAPLPYYAGQVKCIFLDPPYNTQSAIEHYDDNLEHSIWLSTLYPRLEMLCDFLADDGSIWVSMDDNEGHYLKVIMDEVFGRANFITSITWIKRVSPANDAKRFSTDHDNILVFAKNKDKWFPNRLPRTEVHNSHYKNPDNDTRGNWNSATYTGNKNRKERPNLYYGITNPNGEVIYPPETLTWRYGQETHQENEREKLLHSGKDGKSRTPRLIMFLDDAEPIAHRTVWHASEIGSTRTAMVEQKLLSSQPFSTPKPELLLNRILHCVFTSALYQKFSRRVV